MLLSATLFSLFSASAPAQSVGPVAGYAFDEGSGTVANDNSGRGNSLALNGPSWTTGRSGSALSFDGSNDRAVARSYRSELNLQSGFTLSAWINPRTNSGWQMIVNKPSYTSHQSPYFDWSMHRQASTGRISTWLGCDRQQRVTNVAIANNKWTHVAVTYDGSTIREYINGILNQTHSVRCTVPNTSSQPIRVGSNAVGSEVFNGSIDDVRVYNRVLGVGEIQTAMGTSPSGNDSSGSPPPTPTVSSSLSASPSSGSAPLSGVSLTAGVSGTATGTITYTFYCNRSDTGTNVTTPYSRQVSSTSTSYTASGLCTYNEVGNYTPKVIVQRAGYLAEARSGVAVSAPPNSPKPTVSISASPTSVTSGGSSNLTWSSNNATSCSASGAWSGSKATAGSASTGALSSSSTFTLTCSGTGGSASASANVSVTAASGGSSGATTGLDFPGSASTSGTIRFQFTNPLPIYPATYIWRVYPRQQNGYYTAFFWGNNGNFWWDAGAPNTYYGAHPYPTVQPNGGTHKWEIAVNGGDFVSNETVGYGRWYTQALRVWSDGSGKHHEFYWDLPDTSRVIRRDEPSSYGNKNPPSPVLVWGDAPWNESNELMNGIMRGIQVYSTTLSVNDVLAEVNSPRSTSGGASNMWYMNLNPTPSDISDKSGAGHNPSWVGSGRPTLWSGQ